MNVLSFLLMLLACLGAGCTNPVKPRPVPGPVACTMEAKQCPDGSYVGRTGPNCEFSACPVPSADAEGRYCTGPSDTSCGAGHECSQECGPPVVRDSDPTPGYSCHVIGQPRICPRCLASNTMIATPFGNVNIKDIQPGSPVWSQNAKGERVKATVIRVSSTAVPKTHKVIHLVLKDGRQVWVSPNHPLANSQPLATLQPGDSYDGSTVQTAELVVYKDAATYDLLPNSDTGVYWADGILLGSTLR